MEARMWLLVAAVMAAHASPTRIMWESDPVQRLGGAHTNRLAVAIPFHISQYHTKLIPTLRIWKDIKPCAVRPAPPHRATLVFVYSGDPDADMVNNHTSLRQGLTHQWRELEKWNDCFSDMEISRVHVSKENDRYSDAPCIIFLGMLENLFKAGNWDHVYQMETDVRPIREGWLDAVLQETVSNHDCKQFWQRGSVPHCQTFQGRLESRYDVHINGNAIWCLKDKAVWDFLDQVKAYYPPADHSGVAACGTAKWAETGVDHAMYRFRRDPANFEYVRKIIHKFTYTQTMLNKCEDAYTIPQIRAEYPETFLVHSKAPFLPAEVLMAREAIVEIFNRWPEQNEQDALKALVGKNKWSKQQLSAHLCQTPEALGLIDSHNYAPVCQELCYKFPTLFSDHERFCGLGRLKKKWMDWRPNDLYVWTSDFDAWPIQSNLPVINNAGAVVHAEIEAPSTDALKPQCDPGTAMCRDRLKVLGWDQGRGFSLDPCPNYLRQSFFEAYKDDPEFERVDAFFCSYPAANCELYMPFNRSLIVYATTRLEAGRHDELVDWRKPYINLRSGGRWRDWVRNLQRIAGNPMNTIAANSKFEVAYIKHHTGIDAVWLPSWAGDKPLPQGTSHIGRGVSVVVGVDSAFEQKWEHPILKELKANSFRYEAEEHTAPKFKLVEHQPTPNYGEFGAVVLIPSQPSLRQFFEFYRMNIPVFAPSKSLLVSWQTEHDLQNGRVLGHPTPANAGAGYSSMMDPGSDDENALEFWLGLSDWYHFEHVVLFDSWKELYHKLRTSDLAKIRSNMTATNQKHRNQLVRQWSEIFQRVRQHSAPSRRVMPKDFKGALMSLYRQPALGPDLPITLPSTVSDSVRRLAQSCPAIKDRLKCMCLGVNKPNTHYCNDFKECIPSDLYNPPEESNTFQVAALWPRPKPPSASPIGSPSTSPTAISIPSSEHRPPSVQHPSVPPPRSRHNPSLSPTKAPAAPTPPPSFRPQYNSDSLAPGTPQHPPKPNPEPSSPRRVGEEHFQELGRNRKDEAQDAGIGANGQLFWIPGMALVLVGGFLVWRQRKGGKVSLNKIARDVLKLGRTSLKPKGGHGHSESF